MRNWHTQILRLVVVLFNLQTILASETQTKKENDSEGAFQNILLGYGLVVFGATLSTLGSMILFLDRPLRSLPWFDNHFSLATSKPFLASSLSFSTGVLITTIFLNLIPEGINGFHCSNFFGDFSGLGAAAYFGLCMSLVLFGKKITWTNWFGKKNSKPLPDVIIRDPELSAIEEVMQYPNTKDREANNEINKEVDDKLMRENFKKLGYQVAGAIALHNFPEGVVLFVSAYRSLHTGILFGTALALHKFPEGIMIGVPIFFGTNSKWKAAGITAAASFTTQLLGATFAFLLFKVFWNDIIAGALFLLAASILIHTVISGMLPLGRQYDPEDKYCTTWICAGVATFIFLTSVIRDDTTSC